MPNERGKSASRQGGEHHQGGGESKESRGRESDLRQREYTDEKGEVHHHTRTAKEPREKKE